MTTPPVARSSSARPADAPHQDRWASLPGGLRMHARYWPGARSGDDTNGGGGAAKAPVIFIPGLSRNTLDFNGVAEAAAATGREVYAVSLRGRGLSDRDPAYLNYKPETYRDDILGLMDQFDIPKALLVGTSLGGIITMLVAEKAVERLTGAAINDVGPRLHHEGLARIGGYMAIAAANADADPSTPTLAEAALRVKAINELAFPGKDEEFWRDFAKRTYAETQDGRWTPMFDPAIGKALAENGPGDDLWPGFRALAAVPTLVIRGALSDLLTSEIVEEMAAERPGLEQCEVPNTGHAPMLTEPVAATALARFYDQAG